MQQENEKNSEKIIFYEFTISFYRIFGYNVEKNMMCRGYFARKMKNQSGRLL